MHYLHELFNDHNFHNFHSDRYGGQMECAWHVTVNPGSIISIEIVDIDLSDDSLEVKNNYIFLFS